jgi:hypothetical protein
MKRLNTLNTSISEIKSDEKTGIMNIRNGVQDQRLADLVLTQQKEITPSRATTLTVSLLESMLNCVISESVTAEYDFKRWILPRGNIFSGTIEEQKEQHKKTINLMKKLMVCADQSTIENWIMEVLVCTTAQARLTEADLALKCRVYANKLSHIPADILKAACDEVCRTSTFFPSLAEFIKYTDKSYIRRVQLVDNILSKIETYSDKNDHNNYLSA